MRLPAAVVASVPAERWQQDLTPFLSEWRGLFFAQADGAVCPQSTGEVASLLRACSAERVAVVPQGGNTGLVGGSVPFTAEVSAALERPVFDMSAYAAVIVLSLTAMNRVRSVDPENFSMALDAGCVLADAQAAAEGVNRYFPLSVASERQCQIGGNLASNCGGINVLRYGNTRDLVLGIEAVTAQGEVINQMTSLRKNNMGYSLKDLLVGSEGSLAIITAAVLKLFPRPTEQVTALLALQQPDDAVTVLAQAREQLGDLVSGCELMSAQAFEFAMQYGSDCRSPFSQSSAWYLLLEFSGFESTLPQRVSALMDDLVTKLALQFSLAVEAAEREALWHIRKSIPGAQKHAGASVKHDVSVPVASIPIFLERAMAAVTDLMPEVRPCPFGHLGDGNLHFNLSQPESMSAEAFLAQWQDFNRVVHDLVIELGGSIAAEHGVGQMKTGELQHYLDEGSYAMMTAIKQALDPHNILNPGKVLSSGATH
jgi:D-lactate dehydrogenase (cytochrome)